MPYRRRGVRSWRVSGLVVLFVGVSSWRRSHSFVLRRGGMLALILCPSPPSASRPFVSYGVSLLVPPCPAGWGGGACLLIQSGSFFSCSVACRGAGASCRACPPRLICSSCAFGRGVSFLCLGERLVGVSSSMMCPLRWRGVLAVPWASSRLIVSWSGEASASRFSSRRGADERWFPSCRLGAGACSDAVGDGAMLFSSSAFPIWFIVACFSFPVAIALASCRSFDSRRAGREAGRRLLAWILWRGSSCLVDGCI